MKRYDLGIIGSGPGGYKAALRAAQEGKKVCVVEENIQTVGGVCLNKGCIPTKSLINSANILNLLSEANEAGIEVNIGKIDIKKIVEVSQQSIEKLKKGLLYLFKKNNIDLIEGIGSIIDGKHIKVNSEGENKKIEVDNIIIATGSRPKTIPGIEIDGDKVITSDEVIKLNEVPENFLIIGGGAIGVEFAAIFNNLGAKVTVVEMMHSLLPQEDKEISACLGKNFRRKGIDVLTNSKVKKISFKNNKVIVDIKNRGSLEQIETDVILVAVGRVPNTEKLGLKNMGIELDEKKFIKVNKNMQTAIANIYAVGDIVNSPLLAHVAFKEAKIAVDFILGKEPNCINYENVPNVVYSEPEVASVGLTEKEAEDKNCKYKTGKYFYRGNSRAVVSGKTEGVIKVIIDKKSGRILGAHIIGANASEIIHEYIVSKQNKVDIKKLSEIVHAHPTLSEMAIDVSESLV